MRACISIVVPWRTSLKWNILWSATWLRQLPGSHCAKVRNSSLAKTIIHWLIAFNGMPNRRRLFYDTKQHLMVRLEFWKSGEYVLLLHCHYSQFTLTTSKIMLATVVEGDPKAPSSIATTLRCRGGRYSFPLIAPLWLLHPWSVSYNAECQAKRHQVPFFESLVWLDLGLNSGLPGHCQVNVY